VLHRFVLTQTCGTCCGVIEFEVNGEDVGVRDEGASLLEVLRDQLRVLSPKDGCSPQGQCGCCTVWIDGKARVACVTPVKRVHGRSVTTVEGLPESDSWAEAFCAAGASQCGFCTPGIVMRLAALPEESQADASAVDKALVAHLCRCTGWKSVVDACVDRRELAARIGSRDLVAASERAELEGGSPQAVGPEVASGQGGFADDLAPKGALVAMLGEGGTWFVAETLSAARLAAGKIPGRRTTAPITWPIDPPAGEWMRTLQTTWVEPAYLEPDAAWCEPGGEPMSPLGNGGAFGGKHDSDVAEVARQLADTHGRPVRVIMTREDTVRRGPKRPPIGAGIRADGSGIMRLARPGSDIAAARIRSRIEVAAPLLEVEFIDVAGPLISDSLRAVAWAEALILLSSLAGSRDRVVAPNGATAEASIREQSGEDVVSVSVRCGEILDEVVLRSYCIGAAHMALGWVRSEALAVDIDGTPLDLTIRSFGILRAPETPRIEITLEPDEGPPLNGSNAVFAAVAAAAWRTAGYPQRWPVTAVANEF
jgi:xanthine dehydrogenase small subunit